MSQTQIQRPKRSHVFFMKIILVVFVLIFAAVIGFNVLRGIMQSASEYAGAVQPGHRIGSARQRMDAGHSYYGTGSSESRSDVKCSKCGERFARVSDKRSKREERRFIG